MREAILIIEQNSIYAEMIKLLAYKFTNAEVTVTDNAKEGIKILQAKSKSLKCIVVDSDLPTLAAQKVMEALESLSLNIPVIVITLNKETFQNGKTKTSEKSFYGVLEKPNILAGLKKSFTRIFAADAQDATSPEKDYLPVDLRILQKLDRVGVDTFLKLTDEKFIRILASGDYFGEEDYQKYKKKGFDALYIKNETLEALLEKWISGLESLKDLDQESTPEALDETAQLSHSPESKKAFEDISQALKKVENNELSYEEGMEISLKTLTLIQQLGAKLEMNRDMQQLTKAAVALSIKTIQKSPKLSELFEKLRVEPESYLYSHSMVLASISCNIASLMGWTSNLTHYKLILASFLHDITLDNQKLARLRTLDDVILKSNEFKEAQIEAFIHHPEDAAQLIREFREIPPDVDLIVTQHHERADGRGFPKKLTYKRLSPLSCVFIVSHDLVSYIFDHEKENWNLVSFLNRYRSSCQTGLFKEIFEKLWDSLVNSVRDAA